jgi:hypothetical protein
VDAKEINTIKRQTPQISLSLKADETLAVKGTLPSPPPIDRVSTTIVKVVRTVFTKDVPIEANGWGK